MPPRPDELSSSVGSRRCPVCGRRFSEPARFCPFDGGALVAAGAWRAAGDALLGRTIDGRYEVEARIGEGGVGSVYRVRDGRSGAAMALKVLRDELAGDAGVRERFLREARTAAGLAHPGLVRITGLGALEDSRPYFVMELLEGLSLRAVLRSAPLSPARAVTIARAIADALAVVHEAGIVHRDLKPENVHVGPGDTVKVVDFGFAVAIQSGGSPCSPIAFGTPEYMSPEQARGEAVDGRADVYALGIVLYEMLTGRVPFHAEGAREVLEQHLHALPPPPSLVCGSGRGRELVALDRVVLACLEKSRERRIPTLRALSAVLADALPVSLAT